MMMFSATIALIGCDQTTTTTTSSDITTTTTSSSLTSTSSTTVSSGVTTSLIDLIPTECQQLEITDGWVPVWCDEFSYTGGIDLTKWSYQTGGGGYGNNELQYYTDREENLYVDGNNLLIKALYEDYEYYEYTSAKIWTVNTESWKYGKFEMRAMIPYGTGTWPAFWMMPSTFKYGGWPDSGEIDIMEHVGYDMNVVHGTIHTERFAGSNGRGGSTTSLITDGTITSIDVANEFHTYGIIWDETSITWYYDGYEFASVGYNPYLTGTTSYDTTVDWPFDQSFYLILNLAIGGNWGGVEGVDALIFPATYTIDYVRVYQQDYITGDTSSPGVISNPQVFNVSGKHAYLIWDEAQDDKNIKLYEVYVNNVLFDKTSVPGVLFTNLIEDSDNYIKIIAMDYSGKFSDIFETVITT